MKKMVALFVLFLTTLALTGCYMFNFRASDLVIEEILFYTPDNEQLETHIVNEYSQEWEERGFYRPEEVLNPKESGIKLLNSPAPNRMVSYTYISANDSLIVVLKIKVKRIYQYQGIELLFDKGIAYGPYETKDYADYIVDSKYEKSYLYISILFEEIPIEFSERNYQFNRLRLKLKDDRYQEISENYARRSHHAGFAFLLHEEKIDLEPSVS